MLKDKRIRKILYKHFFVFFQDKLATLYHDVEDLKFVSNHIINKFGNGAISKPLMGKWKADESKFLVKSKKLDKIDLTSCPIPSSKGCLLIYWKLILKP